MCGSEDTPRLQVTPRLDVDSEASRGFDPPHMQQHKRVRAAGRAVSAPNLKPSERGGRGDGGGGGGGEKGGEKALVLPRSLSPLGSCMYVFMYVMCLCVCVCVWVCVCVCVCV